MFDTKINSGKYFIDTLKKCNLKALIMAIQEIKYYEMFKEIDHPFNSMDKIEWLLLKYNDEYERLEGFLESIKCDYFDIYDDQLFVDIFQEFYELSEFHHFEDYCKEQVMEYENNSRFHHSLQKDWIIKNEQIAVFNLLVFEWRYLEHDRNKEYFKIKHGNHDLVNINLDKNDFRYIIRFLEIFERLYWEQQILPENLKRLELDYGIRKTLNPKAWYYDDNSITLDEITTEIKIDISRPTCWPKRKRIIKNRESQGPSEFIPW